MISLQDIPITELIPQRAPFIMVDRVISCDAIDAVAEFVLQPDNIFLDDGIFSSAGIIENLAQSCAARMGCINIMNGGKVKIGYIGEIKKFHILSYPKLHDKITTHIHVAEEVMNITLAEVCSKVGDKTIAQSQIKIALMD